VKSQIKSKSQLPHFTNPTPNPKRKIILFSRVVKGVNLCGAVDFREVPVFGATGLCKKFRVRVSL
jgi:hypothetical protein